MTREDKRKQKRTPRTAQADTVDIDVANVSDDIYYDRRNLRENLNNISSDSMRSFSSSSTSRDRSGQKFECENRHSSKTLATSNVSERRPNSSSPRIKNNREVENDNVDVPKMGMNVYVNTNFKRKESLDGTGTLDGSHLDWEGDGITVMTENSKEIELNNKKKGAAVIVHDDKGEGGGRGRRIRGSTKPPKNRRGSLGFDIPLFSKVSRQSGVFEKIWGEADAITEDELTYTSDSAGSESGWRSFVHRVKSHGKMVLLCIAISLTLIVVIGVLIAMIPAWLRSEERGESGEVGGLAYEDEGVLMDSSSSSSSSGGSSGAGSEKEVAGTSKLVLIPPPYDLISLCNQNNLLVEGGYDSCVSACFPSRCCLVDESETYEVWTLHIGANDIDEIGKTITPCFKDHGDTCMRYNDACSILGKDSLLPKKPPSSMEVLAMNNVEKLDLAESILRACSPRNEGGKGEGLAECQALCESKACCFVDEDETERVTDTGASSILEGPSNNLEEELEGIIGTAENGSRKVQRFAYCGDDPQQFCLTYAGCETYFL